MIAPIDSDNYATQVERLSNELKPLMSGIPAEIRSAAMANLFALNIAGYVGRDADRLVELEIETFVKLVRDLLPVHRREILAIVKQGAH